jgi:tRNA pseudouridine55 synthase
MTRPQIDGILDIHKLEGSTSMDVVRAVKRLTHVKRVGHAGTLDPIATGVLPVCLGQATRLMEYVVDQHKIYRAEFRLGAATDTHDAYGTVVNEQDPSGITRSEVEALLPVFTGDIQQQPPMYSALKREGKRLYDLARAGVEVERPTREVSVYSLSLVDWSPPLATIEVECGRGLYVRTLVHDIGATLGCGAHLSALIRLKVGPFTVDDAVTPEEFEAAVTSGTWEDLLSPPDVALLGHDSLTVAAPAEEQLRHGQAIPLPDTTMYARHLELRRAYTTDGRFLGVLRFNRAEGIWQPEKVFTLAEPSPYAPSAEPAH